MWQSSRIRPLSASLDLSTSESLLSGPCLVSSFRSAAESSCGCMLFSHNSLFNSDLRKAPCAANPNCANLCRLLRTYITTYRYVYICSLLARVWGGLGLQTSSSLKARGEEQGICVESQKSLTSGKILRRAKLSTEQRNARAFFLSVSASTPTLRFCCCDSIDAFGPPSFLVGSFFHCSRRFS